MSRNLSVLEIHLCFFKIRLSPNYKEEYLTAMTLWHKESSSFQILHSMLINLEIEVSLPPYSLNLFWSLLLCRAASIKVVVIKYWTYKSLWNIIPAPGNHYTTEYHHFTWLPGNWHDAHFQCWSPLCGSEWTTLQEDSWNVERHTIFYRYVYNFFLLRDPRETFHG